MLLCQLLIVLQTPGHGAGSSMISRVSGYLELVLKPQIPESGDYTRIAASIKKQELSNASR